MNASYAKFLSLATLWTAVGACEAESPPATLKGKPLEVVPGVLEVGRISHPRLTECSGIAASRQYPGLFWTHNDGGGFKKQVLYGISAQGKIVTEFRIGGVLLHDWEDLAMDGDHHLFIADVGNNNAVRKQLAVYEIDEPDPKSPMAHVEIRRGWQLLFPDAPFDCESLVVWKDHGYVISKVFNGQRAEIYRFPLTRQKKPFVLEPCGRLKIDSPVTGASISDDGMLLGVVAKSGAYVFRIEGEVSRASHRRPWHRKFSHEHIEGCCFVPEGLLATSESRAIFLFTDEAFHPSD